MTLPPRLWLVPVVFALTLIPGCKPPPESVQVKEAVSGPPDLVAHSPASPGSRAFQMRAFHLNHVWAESTTHKDADKSYGAKLTVWDYANDESAVAELYFDETGAGNGTVNPDPATAKRPYKIRFPLSMLGPVLGTLRNTNEPVFLYYYDGAWAIGTYAAEPVGAD